MHAPLGCPLFFVDVDELLRFNQQIVRYCQIYQSGSIAVGFVEEIVFSNFFSS